MPGMQLFTVRADRRSFQRTMRRLKNVQQQVRNRVLRKSMRKALKPLVAGMRKTMQPRKRGRVRLGSAYWTGTLKKSIGHRIKSYRGSGTTFGIVGARSGHARTVVPPGRYRARKMDPIRYSHLADRKHRFISQVHWAHSRTAVRILAAEVKRNLKAHLRGKK